MEFTKGDKTIKIPGWAFLVGALIVDNVATNLIRLKALKVCSNCKKEES